MNYLIYGSSYRLIDLEIEKIASGLKREVYYLDEVDISIILEDLGYNSMFDTDKVLVLKNMNVFGTIKKENEESLDKLSNYLSKPNEHTTLIFTSNEKLSSRGPLKNVLSKLKTIETPIMTKSYELAKLLGEVIKKEGYAITPSTLNNFVEKCNLNYDIALREFEKLKDIKGNNKLISELDIENYVSNYNTTDIFGVKDAIVNRNLKKASTMLDDLESSKMEAIPLVVMLAKEYELVYDIKLLREKRLSNDEIARELGNMHPYRVKILGEAGSKYTNVELERIILELCNIDMKMVSEDNVGYDLLRNLLLTL